jgi:hypothetical protein
MEVRRKKRREQVRQQGMNRKTEGRSRREVTWGKEKEGKKKEKTGNDLLSHGYTPQYHRRWWA